MPIVLLSGTDAPIEVFHGHDYIGALEPSLPESMLGLLIDLDGVLYDGSQPVRGASEALAWLQSQGIPRVFLTNTTSKPRSALVERLAAMNMPVSEAEILTPPAAAARWLGDHVHGPIALFVPKATAGEFTGLPIAESGSPGPVSAVVVGDYGENWDFGELNRAFRMLMTEPQPVLIALGMTRYWRASDGLRLDTAPFVVALSHATGAAPVVLGKPAAPFFETALVQLGLAPDQAFMIGDDIRTDVAAAQDCGIRGILVKTGKFLAADLELGIEPHATLASFADLPKWWRQHLSSIE